MMMHHKMQFYKLRYIFKLMNAAVTQQRHHTCNLLRIIIVLMTVITMSMATKDFYVFKEEENLQNVASQTFSAIKMPKVNETNTKTNQNTSATLLTDASADAGDNNVDDFEQIVSAQLKREEEEQQQEELQTSTGYNTNADYDTMTAAVSTRKSLLSRKRRYLLFPEGASFQVVYDGIFGVVDYTNYLILGITLALAWELPSKAPSEQLEDIKQQLLDGTLLLQRNDTATNITYVDTKSKKAQTEFQNRKPISIPTNSYQKSNPYYDYYYNNNKKKRPVFQSAFMPPMHRNYYYQQPKQSPNIYKGTKPGTSMKYSYYFQPNTRRQYENPYYSQHNHGYGKEHNSDWRRKDNYYYKHMSHKPVHPFKNWINSKAAYETTPYDQAKYPWWNLANRLTNSFRKDATAKAMASTNEARQFNNVNNAHSNQQQEKQSSDSGYYQSNAPTSAKSLLRNASKSTSSSSPSTASIPRKHHIYPVFGKRSLPDTHTPTYPAAATIGQPHNSQQQQQHQRRHRRCGIDSDELSKSDRIHIRHHRRTRHTLYEKIEKFLDKRGSHGHHCVLRALCETSKKSNDPEPGSFLGEVMRTVFTLPEPVDEDLQKLEYKETCYDAAHAFEGDCAVRYFHCKDSLWKSHFIA